MCLYGLQYSSFQKYIIAPDVVLEAEQSVIDEIKGDFLAYLVTIKKN